MARYIFQQNYKDQDGNVVSGGAVTVYLAGTQTTAIVYATLSGGSAIAGSQVISAVDGYFSFYVDDVDYAGSQRFDIQLSRVGFQTKVFVNVAILPGNSAVGVQSVTGGTNVTITGTPTDPIINSPLDGVQSLTAGTNITLGGTATNPIINSTGAGVATVTAGTNVTITGTSTNPIINSPLDGVQSVTAGTNVTVTGTATDPVINSTGAGVATVTAGTNVTITGTSTNPIINSPLDGVQSVTAGTNITLGGTAVDPVVNAAPPGFYNRPYETTYEISDDFLTPAAIKFQGLNSNASIGNGSTSVTGSSNGIVSMFPIGDPSSAGHYGSTGTVSTFDPRTLQSVIPNRFKIFCTPNSIITDKLIILGLVSALSVDAAALSAYKNTGAGIGVFFRVDDINETLNHIFAVTKAGATETKTDTGVVMAANTYHSYEIIALSTSILFYVDDVLKATHTTNIPTAAIGVYFLMYVSVGSAVTKALLVDWYKFSRPR